MQTLRRCGSQLLQARQSLLDREQGGERLDAALVTAAAAVVVAVIALFISVWEAVTSRRHNRLSVRPLVCMELCTTDHMSLVLNNNGLGPAVIMRYLFEIPLPKGGSRTLTDPRGIREVIGDVGLDHVTLWRGDQGDVVASQSSVVLMDLGLVGEEEQARVLAKLEGVTFALEYKSLYQESFKVGYRFTGGSVRPV
jgi:hypothetical protein